MTGKSNEIEWFLARDGEQFGPLSDSELKKVIELGHLRPVDLLWREGMDDWEEAENIFPQQAGSSSSEDPSASEEVEDITAAEPEPEAETSEAETSEADTSSGTEPDAVDPSLETDIAASASLEAATPEPASAETDPPEPDPTKPWAPQDGAPHDEVPKDGDAQARSDAEAAPVAEKATETPTAPVVEKSDDVIARAANRPNPAAIAASLSGLSSIDTMLPEPVQPQPVNPQPTQPRQAQIASKPATKPVAASISPPAAPTPTAGLPAPGGPGAPLATPGQLLPPNQAPAQNLAPPQNTPGPEHPVQPARPMPAGQRQTPVPRRSPKGQIRTGQSASGQQPSGQAPLAAPSQLQSRSQQLPGTSANNSASGRQPQSAGVIPAGGINTGGSPGAHGQLPPGAPLSHLPGDPTSRLPHPATTQAPAKTPRARRVVLPLLLVGSIGGGSWLAYAHGDWLLPKAQEYYQTGLQMAKSMALPTGEESNTTKNAVQVKPVKTRKIAIKQPNKMAVPTPTPATRPSRMPGTVMGSAEATAQNSQSKNPLWQFIEREYPDWYEAQAVQNAGMDTGITKEKWFRQMTASKLVDLRRREAIFVLASSRENLLDVAASFLNNLQVLSKHSTDACYGFISHGVLNPTVLNLTSDTAYARHLDAQNLAVLRAAVAGRKQARAHKAPEPGDYRALGTELIARGWSKADLQLFTDPVALSSAKPAKVCKMVQDWFTAQLALADKDAQLRLLVQSLRPVITG